MLDSALAESRAALMNLEGEFGSSRSGGAHVAKVGELSRFLYSNVSGLNSSAGGGSGGLGFMLWRFGNYSSSELAIIAR